MVLFHVCLRCPHACLQNITFIPAGYSCSRADGTCWLRSYTGLLCPHGLNAAVDRMSRANIAERKNICRLATAACNTNWHRRTYTNANGLEASATDLVHKRFDNPLPRTSANKPKFQLENKKLRKLIGRFNTVAAHTSWRDASCIVAMFELKALLGSGLTLDHLQPYIQVNYCCWCPP